MEETGRSAVGDLRRLLEVLRAEDDDAAAGPLPGLAQLGELADGFRRAGLDVAVAVDALPPSLVAAYVREPPDDAAHVLAPLTDRERDVLRELAAGLTNAEIAAVLYLSRPP